MPTTLSDRVFVLANLALDDRGKIALINFYDGYVRRHIPNPERIAFVEEFADAAGGVACTLPADKLVRDFIDLAHAPGRWKFLRKPLPQVAARLCRIFDFGKLQTMLESRNEYDFLPDHGWISPYVKCSMGHQIAAQITKDNLLDGASMSPMPVIWAAPYADLEHIDELREPTKRANRIRDLFGWPEAGMDTMIFLIHVPSPKLGVDVDRLTGPTVFEAPEKWRFKARYDLSCNAINGYGRTADMDLAYRKPFPPSGADGVGEVVMSNVKVNPDYVLVYFGCPTQSSNVTHEDHVGYLLNRHWPDPRNLKQMITVLAA
jgi:hypothetical protein